MEWFYAHDDQRHGPVTKADIRAMVEAGELPANTLVWHADMEDWTPLDQLPQTHAGTRTAAEPAAAEGEPEPATDEGEPEPATGEREPEPTVAEGEPGARTPARHACSECGRLFDDADLARLNDRYVCIACKPRLTQRIREGAPQSGPMGAPPANTMALTGFLVSLGACVVSVLSLFSCCCLGPFGLVLVGVFGLGGGATGLILSILGLNRANSHELEPGKSYAVIGIILSSAMIVLCLAMGVLMLVAQNQ